VNARLLQLWVDRLAMDPAAWTAGHTLQLLMGKDAPIKVGRADLWELESDALASPEGRAAFEAWMRTSNLFVNPSRDRGVVLDDAPPDFGPAIAHVTCVERGAAPSRAHALTLAHALGGTWVVRRGVVWTLAWPAEKAEFVPEFLETAAWARRRKTGLLVQPESQEARLYVHAWDQPALPATSPVDAGSPAGGSDGGVA